MSCAVCLHVRCAICASDTADGLEQYSQGQQHGHYVRQGLVLPPVSLPSLPLPPSSRLKLCVSASFLPHHRKLLCFPLMFRTVSESLCLLCRHLTLLVSPQATKAPIALLPRPLWGRDDLALRLCGAAILAPRQKCRVDVMCVCPGWWTRGRVPVSREIKCKRLHSLYTTYGFAVVRI